MLKSDVYVWFRYVCLHKHTVNKLESLATLLNEQNHLCGLDTKPCLCFQSLRLNLCALLIFAYYKRDFLWTVCLLVLMFVLDSLMILWEHSQTCTSREINNPHRGWIYHAYCISEATLLFRQAELIKMASFFCFPFQGSMGVSFKCENSAISTVFAVRFHIVLYSWLVSNFCTIL